MGGLGIQFRAWEVAMKLTLFVVESCLRRRGIATALLRASVHWASTAGLSTLRMVYSRSNWLFRKLACKGFVHLDLALDETSFTEICGSPI